MNIRHRIYEFAAGIVVFAAIAYVANIVTTYRRDHVAAEAWFQVSEIFVPDHTTRGDPDVIFDRHIKEEFQGFWIIEVQKQDDTEKLWSLSCSGSGIAHYAPTDYIPENRVRWSWLIGKDCPVGPGVYRLRASWSMKRPGWPDKSLVAFSNIFRVTPH